MTDVFISYSRKDQAFVLDLHAALEERKRDAWVDWEDIPLTAKWREELFSGIEHANTFAFVISPDSIASEYCNQELDHAVENNKRLVPIVRRDVDDEFVPDELSSHQYICFRESDDFDKALMSLINPLRNSDVASDEATCLPFSARVLFLCYQLSLPSSR